MRGTDACRGNASAVKKIDRTVERVAADNWMLFFDDLPRHPVGVAGGARMVADQPDA